jgi:hypothetical protein
VAARSRSGGGAIRAAARPAQPLRLLLDLVDEAFDHKSWHGTTLFGSLRGMTPEVAAWRPAPARHNIWEIVVHAAYWKYAVRRRLAGDKRGSFPFRGSNWFARPPREAPDGAWPADVRLLADEHRRLRDAVASVPPSDLERPANGQSVTPAYLIRGIAAHDLYHAGQIQLIKRLRTGR